MSHIRMPSMYVRTNVRANARARASSINHHMPFRSFGSFVLETLSHTCRRVSSALALACGMCVVRYVRIYVCVWQKGCGLRMCVFATPSHHMWEYRVRAQRIHVLCVFMYVRVLGARDGDASAGLRWCATRDKLLKACVCVCVHAGETQAHTRTPSHTKTPYAIYGDSCARAYKYRKPIRNMYIDLSALVCVCVANKYPFVCLCSRERADCGGGDALNCERASIYFMGLAHSLTPVRVSICALCVCMCMFVYVCTYVCDDVCKRVLASVAPLNEQTVYGLCTIVDSVPFFLLALLDSI